MEGNAFALPHVLSVNLKGDWPYRPECEALLVMQAEDVLSGRSGTVSAQDLTQRVQRVDGVQRAQREDVEPAVEAGGGTGIDRPAAQVRPWGRVGDDDEEEPAHGRLPVTFED